MEKDKENNDKTQKNWEEIMGSEEPEQDQKKEESVVSGILEHPDYKALLDKLTEVEQQSHTNWEAALRAQSDAENRCRRAEDQAQKSVKMANESLIKGLLPVLDSLEQALLAGTGEEPSVASMREGIELTLKLFLSTLEKSGLRQVDPQGQVFDPNLHEAISSVENAEVASNTILTVFQKGYVLHERVVRPARVVVAKNNGA